MMKTSYLLTLIVTGFVASVIAMSSDLIAPMDAAVAQTAGKEVPFGDKVGPAIINYNRLRPNIATAGLLKNGAIIELKLLGFATILDLRSQDEGAEVEKQAVEAAGLRYFNIPVTDNVPSDAQVTQFAHIVENAAHFPLIIHCVSANRVGAMWTLYRAYRGIPISIAVEEGRTIGMQRNREDAVLKHLRHPDTR